MYRKIFINQCGYLPDMRKQLTCVCDQPVAFTVCRSDGSAVFSGTADRRVENTSAGEVNYTGDFSSCQEPGVYFVRAEGLGESDLFPIGPDVYCDLMHKSIYFFYLQRCGSELPKEAAGRYAHPACHTKIAFAHGSKETAEVTGGWHDAGDYGRYIVPGAMTVAQLLMAIDTCPALLSEYKNPYDATKQLFPGMPDYLTEIRYELDWMLKLQRPDGTVYHKATCKNFCGFIMPDAETEDMVLSPVSVTATADLAAVCALAIPYYRPYDEAYAQKLADAAKLSYRALASMELPGGFHNPADVTTGEYDDKNDEDERYWAAAELYKAFGEESYRKDFEAIASRRIYHGYGWADMGSYGNLAYLSCSYPVDHQLKERIIASMKELAKQRLEIVSADGYGTALKPEEYIWGSNFYTTLFGLHLIDGYRLTGDTRYLDAAKDQLHYLLGRNPMGLCYVTGCGTNSIRRPHHRPSGFHGIAMPGMLSGGPCTWGADALAKELLTDAAPAKCLLDMTGSYSTNEVTIYWNSAMILLLADVLA